MQISHFTTLNQWESPNGNVQANCQQLCRKQQFTIAMYHPKQIKVLSLEHHVDLPKPSTIYISCRHGCAIPIITDNQTHDYPWLQLDPRRSPQITITGRDHRIVRNSQINQQPRRIYLDRFRSFLVANSTSTDDIIDCAIFDRNIL